MANEIKITLHLNRLQAENLMNCLMGGAGEGLYGTEFEDMALIAEELRKAVIHAEPVYHGFVKLGEECSDCSLNSESVEVPKVTAEQLVEIHFGE